MPTISGKTKQRINEQVLAYLFSTSPESKYTANIARELARDEEFIKSLLHDLEKQKLVVKITKSAAGLDFTRRQRWRLSNSAYEAYTHIQRNNPYNPH